MEIVQHGGSEIANYLLIILIIVLHLFCNFTTNNLAN